MSNQLYWLKKNDDDDDNDDDEDVHLFLSLNPLDS